ncbi:fumarylacetoacetate hydrolase family protein [Microbacterium soli]|uniref:Fumarylacetoacetase-like C-terminal domain-containing protein n=1 Tax=Microbacterium soli TaxID=446075 RepID=A0ABP7NM34_9MICO
MRLATISQDGQPTAALVTDHGVAPVSALRGRDAAHTVRDIIRHPLQDAEVRLLSAQARELGDIEWLPPVIPPKNIFCVGKNYLEHVREGAKAEGVPAKVPEHPIWFTKAHTALTGHRQPILLDHDLTDHLDYEAELAVVIGRPTFRVSVEDALSHVFGYTLLNDITARNIQQQRNQWFLGKSANTYAPCGPWIVTADEVPDPQKLRITSAVNGEERQNGVTRDMLFSVAELISDLSRSITLEPGDIIATGTPQGVAWGMDAPRYLEVGDNVSVDIVGLGQLQNPVVAATR